MSSSPSDENHASRSVNNIRAFIRLLPNLEVIDLSYMKSYRLFTRFFSLVIWSEYSNWMACVADWVFDGSGGSLLWVENVIEIYHDETQLVMLDATPFKRYSMAYDDQDQVSQNYLLYRCPRLECLSIMNATWSFPGSETSNPVTQEMLLKMVRHHRSDSTLASKWSDAREHYHATGRETGNHVCKLSMGQL
jgi:hypothetical protein